MGYRVIMWKEILDHLISLRFMSIFTVTVAVLEAGALITDGEYKKAKEIYDRERAKVEWQLRERCKHGLGWFSLEGPGDAIRPPTPLWFLASDRSMALNKVGNDWTMKVGDIMPCELWVPWFFTYPYSALSDRFGSPQPIDLDWAFIVGVFMSLMALVLVYDSVSGEREGGTLRLIMSNPIPRYALLISKILAAWICLMIPLSLGAIIDLLITGIGEFHPLLWIRLLLAFILSGLYLLAFICIGILISSIFRNSASSMAICFLIWIAFIVILPGILGTWAIGGEKPVEISDHRREYEVREFWLGSKSPLKKFEKTLPLGADDPDLKDPRVGEVPPGFYRPITSPNRIRAIELKAQFAREIQEIVYQDNWKSEVLRMNVLRHARNKMRISVASIYRFAMQALAGSDLPDYEEFLKQYNEYRKIFMQFVMDLDRSDPESLHIYGHPDGMSHKQVPFEVVPRFYHRRDVLNAISGGITDLSIIIILSISLFLVTNIVFMRSDVR